MRIDFQPNEQVIKSSDILLLEEKIPMKLILTSQNRLYFVNSSVHDFTLEKDDIEEINYFDKNLFIKNGVIIKLKDKDIKFLIKNRKDWEKPFSNLY